MCAWHALRAVIIRRYGALVLVPSPLSVQLFMIPFLAMFRVALFSCLFGFIAKTFGFGSFGELATSARLPTSRTPPHVSLQLPSQSTSQWANQVALRR